jgi:hypothetical protein
MRSAALALCAMTALASAQPADPSASLHDANAAATAGDWARVSALVDPLLARQLAHADLAEAHRLAGLAAFFAEHTAEAEAHFLAYLKLELDAQLDPALVPPEAVTFFNDVKVRHAAELRALRPPPKRYWILNAFPPFGQLQNGERTKAIVLGSALGAFAIANVTSFFVLRSWCTTTSGPNGTGASCDTTVDHSHASASLRTLNIASGIGFLATYAFGVYDGVVGYRRRTREHYLAPYASSSNDGGVVGVMGSF